VIKIYELGQVAIFNTIFRSHILVLVMVVLAILSKAYCRKSLLIKRNVIAAPKIAVEAEHQHRLEAYFIGTCDFGDVAGDLAGGGIAVTAEIANELQLGVGGGNGHAFGKDAHHAWILLRIAVATYDVVVEHCFNVPPFRLRHLCEMMAAVQALLFAG